MQRRPFVLSAAAAAIGAGLTKAAESKEPTKKLGWALVGLGSLSTNQLAPALQKTKHARLSAVVTGTPAKAERWKKKYGLRDSQVYDYENYDKIADDPDIDVIYVVLPNSMHAEFTIRAAKAGKHVFCEKPMANSAEDCRRMIAACREAGKQLGIGYRCQFVPQHLEAMRFAREGVFGALRHLDAGFGFKIGDPKQWRLRKALAGGGAIMDVGIYALQACRYLAGEEPVEVMAQETKTDLEKFKEVDESIQWMMKFPSGVTASCATTYAYRGINRVAAYADDGSFGLEPAFGYSGVAGWTSKDGIAFPSEQIDHFAAEIDAFSESIQAGGEGFEPSGEEGLRDLLVIEAIHRSIREGAPVRLG